MSPKQALLKLQADVVLARSLACRLRVHDGYDRIGFDAASLWWTCSGKVYATAIAQPAGAERLSVKTRHYEPLARKELA